MSKRLLALLLCLVMCLPVFVGCSASKDDDDKGAYITMYLSTEIYNFDPAYAYMNEEAETLVSLLFARLFTLNSKGKVVGDLVDEYKINEDEKTHEYTMQLILRDAWWSDKTKLTADDIVFAWKRILNSENSFASAALLFDIKNARAVKAGNCSIDDLGICALNDNILLITFEKPIDYDQFILNLTSLALAPIREDYASKSDDWAKKPGTMVTSGPFKIGKTVLSEGKAKYRDTHAMLKTGEYDEVKSYSAVQYAMLVLERNACYNRDPNEDYAIDKSVKPYRILVDCTRTDEEIWQAFLDGENLDADEKALIKQIQSYKDQIASIDKQMETSSDKVTLGKQKDKINEDIQKLLKSSDALGGEIFFMGTIPFTLRTNEEVMKKATVTDALSTQVLYLNEDAEIMNNTTEEKVKLFANADVRLALSLALDRAKIADGLVLASPATALVPNGIFEKGTSGSFRKEGGDLIGTGADLTAAKAALTKAGIKASDYSFSIIVNANDDALIYMAEIAVEAWKELGFDVKLEKRGTIFNNDYYKPTDTVPADICDELYLENLLYRDYQVMALDYCAYSADPYSLLAPFAADFSGMVDSEFNMIPHYTGYNSDEYNKLFEAIYFLPYFDSITSADYTSFVSYDTEEEFKAVLDGVKAVYDQYEIDTAKAADARTKLLHEAEKLLMADMPVIPVAFNKTATIRGEELSKVTSTYYTSFFFDSTKLSDYDQYVDMYDLIYSGKKDEE